MIHYAHAFSGVVSSDTVKSVYYIDLPLFFGPHLKLGFQNLEGTVNLHHPAGNTGVQQVHQDAAAEVILDTGYWMLDTGCRILAAEG